MVSQRAKNSVGKEEGRGLLLDSMDWRDWECEIEGLLDANDWLWWHMPVMPTKELNQRFKAGLLDYIAAGKPATVHAGQMRVIEAKTGKGKLTKLQKIVLRAFLLVPGVDGGVFYPRDREKLRLMLGGKEVKA